MISSIISESWHFHTTFLIALSPYCHRIRNGSGFNNVFCVRYFSSSSQCVGLGDERDSLFTTQLSRMLPILDIV